MQKGGRLGAFAACQGPGEDVKKGSKGVLRHPHGLRPRGLEVWAVGPLVWPSLLERFTCVLL